jgi:hypothetical protein
MTTRKILALVLSLFALAYVSLAFAEENAGNNQGTTGSIQERKTEWGQKRGIVKATWEQKKEQWKTERENILEKWKQEKDKLRNDFKEKFTAERCARIQKRVEERTSNFDERQGKHKKVYDNLVNRINKFISRFEAAKLDTTNLKSYLVTLQEKMDKFSTDYAAYIAKLKESKSFTCGHSEGEFKGALVDAKAELKMVHDDAADIRAHMKNTIIPEIKTLRDKMPKDENKDEDKTPDTTAPTVSITSPADTTYTAAGTVTISANATDNKEVKRVEFYDGGTLKGTDKEEPYSYDWVITNADNGTHSWTAKAYDEAEPANTAVSAAVALTVTIP